MRIDAAKAESSMLATSENAKPGLSDAYRKIGDLQVKMINRADQMSDTEREIINHAIERYKILAQ
jgi:hypothetical protein